MSNSAPLFSFAVVADSHLNPEGVQNTSPWRTNRLANARNESLVAELNRLKPAFVVHLGDIVHPLPASPLYGPAADFAKRLFGQLACPFHLVPGNHDIGDKPLDWMPADCITEEAVRLYRATFGRDWDAFDHGHCRFIRMNTSLLNSGLPSETEQKRWLESEIAAASGRRIFLFTHYPAYVSSANEASHYDNLDEPGRSWLLDLLVRHGVEAVFAGHVHNFFYNRHGATHCYVLPSVTSLRQDYAEFFRIEPAEEYGRNDTAKLGFFVVDVHADRHVARLVRTHGATPTATTARPRRGTERALFPVGVHLRHAWAEEIELPYNAPLDELSRKRVRNDYGVLAMWDLGIANLRVPLSDLQDERIRSRMADMHDLGRRFTVFTFGTPDRQVLEIMQAHRAHVHRWEIILPLRTFDAALDRLRQAPLADLPPISFSKLRGHAGGDTDHSKPFDHTIALGFDAGDGKGLDDLWTRTRPGDVFAGVAFMIDFDQTVRSSVEAIGELSARFKLCPTVCVKLSPMGSAAAPPSEHAIANRVAEAVLCAWQYPQIEMFLDTFQDVDRGYFLRPGLVDRRLNPRLAGHVYRDLHLALAPLEPRGPLREVAGALGRGIAFRSETAEGVLWLPGVEQCAGAKAASAAPLIAPERAETSIAGPWLEMADFDPA